MSDEMDPCECLWNHELAMRRLITLLRAGQSYCTETECLETLPQLPASGEASSGFMMLFLTLALAVAMYAFRPRRTPQLQDADKPSRRSHDHDDRGAPPTPPRV